MKIQQLNTRIIQILIFDSFAWSGVLTLHNVCEQVMVICVICVTLLSSMYEGITTFNIFLYELCLLLSYTFIALLCVSTWK